MSKYRKKPVVIDAEGPLSQENAQDIAQWCGGKAAFDAKPSDPTDVAVSIKIPTLEGVMRADGGDYVIRGVHGEFYPCKPAIFDATYEPA